MPWHYQVVGGGFLRGKYLDSTSAVECGNPGGHALTGFYQRSRLFSLWFHLVGDHQRNAKFANTTLGQSDRNKPATMACHEINMLGNNLFGRHYQVALSIVMLVTDHHDHTGG